MGFNMHNNLCVELWQVAIKKKIYGEAADGNVDAAHTMCNPVGTETSRC